jgi:hypothetical protein
MERSRNLAPWWGLLCAIGALACNFALFINPPLQAVFPWLSLLFAAFALFFLGIGLKRAFAQSQIYRGKILSVVLTAIVLLVVGLTLFISLHSRELPDAAAAPQIGQKVPDFTLADTSGKPVSLDQLLAPASAESQAAAPKAVLLVFYRGYW